MNQFKSLITHSEKGLILDTFDPHSVVLKTEIYACKKGIVAYYDNVEQKVIFYNYKKKSEITTSRTDEVKSIFLTDSAEVAGVLSYNKDLKIFKNRFQTEKTIKDIYKFILTDTLLVVFDTSHKMIIFFTQNLDESIKSIPTAVDFHVFDDNIFYFTRKENSNANQELFHLKNNEIINCFPFLKIESIKIKSNNSNDKFLVSVTTEYSSNSYYGTMKLFLYSKDKENKYNLKEVPSPAPILSYDFINNGIAICYGQQPSNFAIFSENLTLVKNFPNGVRNQFYFNIHENLVCFAGFNNLNGIIEVYRSEKMLAQIKVLGASKIIWSNCGSYFCVCVTNELKVDNRIIIFDYFGRELKSLSFENLINVELAEKEKSNFIILEEPKKLIKIEEIGYVPPHLRLKNSENKKFEFSNKGNFDKKPYHKENKNNQRMKKPVINTKKKIEPKKENIEDLKKKISEIETLKIKIMNGEDLQLEDMNKVLAEDEILEKISKFNE